MAVMVEPSNILFNPTDQMTPGSITQIRNQVKASLLALASHELNLPVSSLVVRDLRWVEDIQAYGSGTTAATVNDWIFTTAADGTTGFVTITGNASMVNNRFVALYGARDLRWTYHIQTAAPTERPSGMPQVVSQIKIDVGGGTRAIWDMSKVQTCNRQMAGVSPSAVIIPQNVTYNIWYYKMVATASMLARIVLDGFVVEPKGLVCSP